MSEAFGTKFIILNDIQQPLSSKIFGPGWIHIASVQRGLKEYMCFRRAQRNQVYVEELDPQSPNLFKEIESQGEWEDVTNFLREAGLLVIDNNRELKVSNKL